MNAFTKFIIYVILLITFLGLINMIFDLHKFAFYGEFIILLGLFVAAIISAIGINNNFKWAWILLTIFFVFVVLDMLLIKAISAVEVQFFFPLIVVSVVGFFISSFSLYKPEEEVVEEEKPVKKTFKPGKYIASKTGAKYHAPKCDWAKKVKKKNAVWFNSKEEAKKAGYKKDTCVK